MWHQVGFLADAFNVFREHGISVDLISTSESNVTVSIDVGAERHDSRRDRGARRGPAQDLQGHGHRRLRRGHARRPAHPHDPARAHAGARGVPGAAGPSRHAGRERPEPHVRRELGARVSARAAPARPAREQVRGRRVRRDLGTAAGRRPAAKALPKPWWVKKKAQLLEIGAAREATYVYDRESIEAAVAALRSLKSVDAVFYAMKANSNREILKLVHDRGLNLECVSPGEIARVLEVLPSLDRKRILFTPNFAPRAEYEHALEQGVWVTLDNLFPLQELGEAVQGQGNLRPYRHRARAAGTTSTSARPARIRSSACRCSRSTSSSSS